MKLTVFFKQDDTWVRYEIIPPDNSGYTFFTKLKLRLIQELILVRKDLQKILGVEGKFISSRPKIDDQKQQKIINILVYIRKKNTESLEISKDISSVGDCIICYKCGNIMHKFPEDIGFIKIGNSYMILDKNSYKSNIQYIYCCINCNGCISESIYQEQQNYKEQREKLLQNGYNWVPNDLGYYVWRGEGREKHINSI